MYKVISILMPFLIQTVLIHRLGVNYVGLQGVYSSVLSVLSVAELGVGSAIVYSMYEPMAKDDISRVCALLSFYRRIYRIVGTLIMCFGLCMLPFLKIIVDTDGIDINIYYVFLLYLVNSVLSYFMYSYRLSILNAVQRTDVISLIGTFTTSLSGILQIIILMVTGNFYLFLCIAILFTIINNLIISMMTNKIYPDFVCKGEIPDDVLYDIRKCVKGVFISKICGITRNAFDSIFVSSFLGLAIAGIYSNYFYVINSIAGVMSIISPALLGGVGNSIQLESVKKNYDDMIRINCIYMMLTGWFTVCLICLYQPFMQVWAGLSNTFTNSTMVLFVLYFYVKQMGNVRAIYSDAAGLFWENRYRALAETIANIILNYLFVKKFGVNGIVGATIITIFFIGFLGSTDVIFRCYFKQGMKKYLVLNLRYATITFVISVFMFALCSFVNLNGVNELLFKMCICLVLPPICFALVGINNHDDKEAMKWLIKCITRG